MVIFVKKVIKLLKNSVAFNYSNIEDYYEFFYLQVMILLYRTKSNWRCCPFYSCLWQLLHIMTKKKWNDTEYDNKELIALDMVSTSQNKFVFNITMQYYLSNNLKSTPIILRHIFRVPGRFIKPQFRWEQINLQKKVRLRKSAIIIIFAVKTCVGFWVLFFNHLRKFFKSAKELKLQNIKSNNN